MDTLVFRTLGPWGPGKGGNLSAAEVDDNFWALAQAIFDLQNDPATPNGIASIAVSGTQMTITLHDGTVLGPYTLPVLTFRWRGEWLPSTIYEVLDVFTVANVGIFMVQIGHTSGTAFDPALAVDGAPALLQLFGAVDASLSSLPDVLLTNLQDQDFLRWVGADARWENVALGSMAYQSAGAVTITGGTITGMPGPSAASDVATKGYVDGAITGGASVPDATMMSNISGTTGPAIAHTLSDYLDHVLTTGRGTMLVRGGTGWSALAPGASGQFLKTMGAGADVLWAAAPGGVTTISAGAGISTGGADITGTGTISLATVSAGTILANNTPSPAAPAPNMLTALLDAAVGNIRGSIAYRGGTIWTTLQPDPSSGKYLKTQGPGADPVWDSPTGAGTVTKVDTGAGLTGGPITSSGVIQFAPTADSTLLANVAGSSAAPAPVTLTQFLDHTFGSSAQGTVIYRSGSTYAALAPGSAGQVLTTGGASANPSWAAGGGGAGPIADHYLLANLSGATAAAIGHSLSDVLDYDIGSTRGTLAFRSSAGWLGLAAGTSGQVLTTGGTTADPSWQPGGAGGAISIGDTPPVAPTAGKPWFDSAGGQLYVFYDDGSSQQWVPASNQPGAPGPQGPAGATGATGATGPAGPNWQVGAGLSLNTGTTPSTVDVATPYLPLTGGTLSGLLTLSGAPTATLHAATKFYVDTAITPLAPLASPALTGNPTAPTPTAGDNDTSVATTAFVTGAITTATANYLPLAGGTLTGSLTVNGSGSAIVGEVGLGAAPSANTGIVQIRGTYTTAGATYFHIDGTFSSSSTSANTAITVDSVFTPTGASLTNAYGINVTASINAGSFALGGWSTYQSQPTLGAGFTGSVSSLTHFFAASPNVTGGSITNQYGFQSAAFSTNNNLAAGSASNRGFFANTITAGAAGGTISNFGGEFNVPSGGASSGTANNHGIYITGNGGTASGGTVNNYAIRSDSTAQSLIRGPLAAGVLTVSKTANYTIVALDNGTHFDNIGAAANITLTLPTAANGLTFSFAVHAAHSIIVDAAGTDIIALGTLLTSAGGTVTGATPYSYVEIECHAAGVWIATSQLGGWATA
jgi:hypothetical protein